MNAVERQLIDVWSQSSYLAAIARKDKTILGVDYYTYNVNITGLAGAAAGQGSVQLLADSDFVLVYQSAVVVAAGAVVATPVTDVQLTDTGAGKTFFSAPTFLTMQFGSGGFPFILPAPRVLVPNTTLLVSVNNLTAATAYDYYFAFSGARIFYA